MEAAMVIGVLILLLVIVPVITLALVLRAVARNNRVSPTIPTLAPTSWLVLPERPARLHRRLRRAVAMARMAAVAHGQRMGHTTGVIAELVDDLERRACVTDSELVVAGRAKGPARWSMLNELERQVDEVERIASRIAGMTSAWASTTSLPGEASPAGLDDIGERLDALEDAMHEVGAIGTGHPSLQPPLPQPAAEPIPLLRRVQGKNHRQ